jgi:tetraacyldisaccharide-1-P 4'-kinase
VDGWQLAAVIIVGTIIVGAVAVMVLMREGRSRKVRVGVFVERDYDGHDKDDPSDWPTQG